ncbi:RNA polymerase sigma-54 factor [Caenibius tardaugens NBRC 16725]|uniref:RNA polymerase sigma-54 factor n=1 Tax=Caenibius tardaugens NBRC 16725 TaxID=1219035 RepID=U2Y5P3_9SPHN|nr:RNA polymerase factor sigma-54 [Caenibius tardaugens]AZI34907.1 RNA polymerase sigma-54 factor [Caenibius tardaugens NBRC 16725]GAD48446.1 RNA polymerase sigma-54 factor [Caenibius tardaugens NBRC 16725]
MALGPRLDIRQSQQLVMTPQLQQAIKLLALSNLEIETFIGDALEANPLLDVSQDTDVADAPVADGPAREETSVDDLINEGQGQIDQPLDVDPVALDIDRDTGDGALFGTSTDSFLSGGDAPDLDERGGDGISLVEHLTMQLAAATTDDHTAFIAMHLIGLLDEAGYLPVSMNEVVADLVTPMAEVKRALALVQTFDPTGVGARDLGECLALQAKEADRYDPCMARLLDNLDLLAKGNIKQLKRICEVDEEDLADMVAELRAYDPKPGLRFSDTTTGRAIVPDILLRPRADGGWDIALNQATLPRLVVNRGYYLELRKNCDDKASRGWLNEKLTDANWLIKALDQRQKTILKVTTEIVKQQDGFFRHGVSELKPLTLKAVADAIDMHESTVSRVTANKYLHCQRGTFELKYFFTSGVASADGEGSVSAEAVKAQIKALIDAEGPKAILSDDALVDLLRQKGFDLARRTVAKYREAMGIGSSVQRRRQKALEAVR